MKDSSTPLANPVASKTDCPPATENDQISQNINAVLDFYTREDEKMSYWQRVLERVSDGIGQPLSFGLILLFVVVWAAADLMMPFFGLAEFDPPPFHWLQGILALAALLTTTIILTKQNRLGKLDEQRDHLDLKVTLLTEQKAAKLIDLVEELRRDLPNVKNRADPEAVALQQSMNPQLVLAALDERAAPDITSSVPAEQTDPTAPALGP
jgi:uncharacterized membrane protein